ncbi:hypothetical protein IGS75_01525 [Gluconobacter sphaericus]|uniref:hypothetical protein n=1 Tax=Gluconobacter sphaericus TaxID=574987 RepID=UPI0019214CCC|nr:hypothetical protein [Gluconobacter sphaericus]QQX91350.1 hypothetical protein IGS75_01525 [Gluconobacter sphaericus]
MRRLLLAVPFLFPLCAQAQTTAANPVEPFSYGVRVGTAKNPLVALLSSVVPSAQAGATQAASPVELFSYGRRVGTQSNPLYINLGNALDSYVTQVSLTSTLSAYLTTSAAAKTYLPLAGGKLTGDLYTGKATSVFFVDRTGAFGYVFNAGNGTLNWTGSGGLIIGKVNLTQMTGTGNAYACIDASGNVYRSSTACQ